jgi:hypothetical protein
MGLIAGTSTVESASTTVISLVSPDLSFIVILLLILIGIGLLDLVRRIFTRT